MKKIPAILFVIASIFLSRQNVKAQIILEHVYDSASCHLYIINLEVEGDKYIWRDLWLNRQIVLYNLDHSIFKTMPLPANVHWPSTDIPGLLYISEHLFNLDNTIEYLFACRDSATYRWSTKIIDEFGNIIFDADSLTPLVLANTPQAQRPIYNTSEGTKMILSYANGGSIAKVYNLGGTLTTSIQPTGNSFGEMSDMNAFPNPSNGSTTIDYQLPEGVNRGEIVLYNSTGTEIKRLDVDRTFTHLVVNNADLASGTYFYQLVTAAGISGSKKMLIVKQ